MSEHNPYAPPTARVEDVETLTKVRPSQILLATRILWIYVVVGIIPMPIEFVLVLMHGAPLSSLIGMLIGNAISFALAAWFIPKISEGRNWARVLMIAYCVIGYLGLILIWAKPIPLSLPQQLAECAQAVLNTAAVVLTCVGPGKYWFKADLSAANKGLPSEIRSPSTT